MTRSSNPTVRFKVHVIELGGQDRLIGRATYASGTEADIPIDTQDDLWRTVADHKYPREQVVFGEGAFEQFRQLPDRG